MNFITKWLEERTGLVTLCSTVAQWKVPSSRCIGGVIPSMVIFAFLTQAITGIVLWLYYSPSAQTSWESVFYMQYVLPMGWLVRGIHHFSAQALVGLLIIYVLVQVFTLQYRAPREFVFWSSLMMFALTLGSCLTGDLLSWTLPGFSATKVRFELLNILPGLGPWLYKLAVGGSGFGTLTPSRFLLLHIAIFGGGFFFVMVLWCWFTVRSRKIMSEKASCDKKSCANVNLVSFWSTEAIKRAFGCVIYMGIVMLLVFQQPLLGKVKQEWKPNPELPFESTVGAHLSSPADPTDSYGGARPEWSFRALYYLSTMECFPSDMKFIPIFVITSGIGLYFFLIPFIGRFPLGLGHGLNVLVVAALFGAACYMTYLSYSHDWQDEKHMAAVHEMHLKGERAIELALAPQGIPSEGALSLLKNDPKIQGPALYKQHCAVCHPFRPLPGEELHPDFPEIPCDEISAPNLYRPNRAEWISGFFDFDRLISEDYYGNTAFVLKEGQDKKDFHGKMYDYVRTLPARMEDEEFMEENNPETLKRLIDILAEESQLDRPRNFTLDSRGRKMQSIDGLSKEDAYLFDSFGCLAKCHDFYNYDGVNKKLDGGELSGYMSRQWMIDFIADAESPRFFGESNDRMPIYHRTEKDAILSMTEIELLVDWLRGKWYRKAAAVEAEDVPEVQSEPEAEAKPVEEEPAEELPEKKPPVEETPKPEETEEPVEE